MRAWHLVLLLACAASAWFPQVASEACDDICYTTELTGFGTGGVSGCTCDGSGATRTGSDGCSCGQCYDELSDGTVIGYAINSDGTCTYGVDCGDCDYSSDSSGSSASSSASGSSTSASGTTSSSTTSRSTTSSSSASSSGTSSRARSASSAGFSGSSDSVSSSNSSTTSTASSSTASTASSGTSTSSSSTSTDGATAGSSSSDSSPSSSSGLATWQIALIICCGVLIFTVAVVSVLTCYCKARNRLNENEDAQADASYYHQPYPGSTEDFVLATGSTAGMATPSRFPQAPGSTRSRPGSASEMKAMYASSVPSNSDRIGLGLVPAHTRTSSGDLAGNYPSERRPSTGSNSLSRRTSQEMQYMARDRERDSLAVEL